MEPFEAHESLSLIVDASQASRRAIARAGTGYLFIIWGIVWLFGYLGNQLLASPALGYLWLGLDSFGILGSIYAIFRQSRHFRTPHSWRMAAFWLLLLANGVLLLWIAWPLPMERYLMFSTILISMGYGLMGLWMSPVLALMGVAISILAVMGWLLIPAYLGYWLALVGGGGLIAAGLYVMKAWK